MNLSEGWSFDPLELRARLRRRVSLPEFFGLLLAGAMGCTAVWLRSYNPAALSDLSIFLRTSGGEFIDFYYGYWLAPVFIPLNILPFPLAAVVWAALNIGGLWAAARIFGGRAALALLAYQSFYILFYGQIGGFIAAGLALAWWGMANRRWGWAGLGFLLAAAKFQSGLILGAALWLLAPLTWRERLKALIVPTAGVLASLLLYPGWPLELLQQLQAHPANANASISLWRYLGPWALLLWLPVIFKPMPSWRRFLGLAAAACLSLPYFQQADLVNLYIFPVGWLPLLGNLGFFLMPFGWDALQILAVVPALLYLAVLWPAAGRWLKLLPA